MWKFLNIGHVLFLNNVRLNIQKVQIYVDTSFLAVLASYDYNFITINNK